MTENVEVDAVYGCHLWAGAVNGRGYGPHVAAFEAATGQSLPPGVVLDHFCRRRRCQWEKHLEPVTSSENRRRIEARYRRALTRCPMGHRLMPGSYLRTPEDGIACLVCMRTP